MELVVEVGRVAEVADAQRVVLVAARCRYDQAASGGRG
jgi:hypothetical protein